MKRIAVVLSHLIVILALTVSVQTQTAKPATKAPAVSANTELIKLAKAGMGEEILLATVAKTPKSRYNTSADALVALKNAGVSEKVIAAILGADSSAPTSTQQRPARATAVEPSTPTGSATRHVAVSLEQTSTRSVDGIEAGIYLSNAGKLVQLEPAVFSGQKTGGKLLHAVTTLFKASIKAVVRSEKANQRVQISTPVFYFYFENKGAGLSNSGGTFAGFMNGASSPNEFVLVRMKVDKNERSIVTGESWTFSDSNGVRSKDTVEFTTEKQRTGVYKVTPRVPLTPGEYCFFYTGGSIENGRVGKLFDFGVDAGAVSTSNQ